MAWAAIWAAAVPGPWPGLQYAWAAVVTRSLAVPVCAVQCRPSAGGGRLRFSGVH